MGIQRFRFYIKCNVCSRPITFLTDPKNADYEMESGATRNYEVWHDKTKTEEEQTQEKILEETLDPMKALENRVLDSKREMDDLDALDEIKAMNLRHIRLLSGQNNTDSATNTAAAGGFEAVQAVLRATDGKIQTTEEDGEEVNENGLTATEEALVKSIKFGHADPQQHERALILSNSDKTFEIKRLDENDEKMIELQRLKENEKLEAQILMQPKASNGSQTNNLVPKFTKKRRRIAHGTEKETDHTSKAAPTIDKNKKDEGCRKVAHPNNEVGLVNLLGSYASDSD